MISDPSWEQLLEADTNTATPKHIQASRSTLHQRTLEKWMQGRTVPELAREIGLTPRDTARWLYTGKFPEAKKEGRGWTS